MQKNQINFIIEKYCQLDSEREASEAAIEIRQYIQETLTDAIITAFPASQRTEQLNTSLHALWDIINRQITNPQGHDK